jgi:cell division protein FtsB
MKELQQKQKIKRRLYSLPALIALLVVTGFAVRGAYGVVMKGKESAQYVSDLRAKTAVLKEREVELKTQIARLETPEGVDTLIKEKFSVSKQGERVAVIVDRGSKATSTEPIQVGWFKKLWQNFKGLW